MKYEINNIKLFGYHGIYEDEKNKGRNYIISVSYQTQININRINDNINNVIDYSKIYTDITQLFNSKRYNLIESIAKDIYEHLVNNHDICKLNVCIIKLKPFSDNNEENIVINYNETS